MPNGDYLKLILSTTAKISTLQCKCIHSSMKITAALYELELVWKLIILLLVWKIKVNSLDNINQDEN